jgi:hypothetical protein
MTVDNYARIGGFAVTILAASYMAIFQHSPEATGALLGLLGLAGSFLYRGKVQDPSA